MANNTTLPSIFEFEGVPLTVHDQNGVPWLSSTDLSKALGYKDRGAIIKIFKNNADEFTNQMTGVVDTATPTNLKTPTRIFSPRGCHLIGMFSKTPRAKLFRQWVLDVLEGIEPPLAIASTPAPTPATQDPTFTERDLQHVAVNMYNIVSGQMTDKLDDFTAVTGNLAIESAQLRRLVADMETRLLETLGTQLDTKVAEAIERGFDRVKYHSCGGAIEEYLAVQKEEREKVRLQQAFNKLFTELGRDNARGVKDLGEFIEDNPRLRLLRGLLDAKAGRERGLNVEIA